MTIGPLRWYGLLAVVGGILTVVDRLLITDTTTTVDVLVSSVSVVLGVGGAMLFRSHVDLVDDELVIVNGVRRHRIPRTQVFDVQHTARWFGRPIEVVVADGRRVAALGCAGLSFRQAPGPRAYERAERPYREVATAVRNWAVTGRRS